MMRRIYARFEGDREGRLVALRRLVLRRARVVARTEPAQTTVTWVGKEEPVSFLKPA